MENSIKLIMKVDKSIDIYVNCDLRLTIPESNRKISAQQVYELLDFEYGSTYNVEVKNEKKVDEQVLIYFKELFDDICERINEMDFNEEDEILKNDTN